MQLRCSYGYSFYAHVLRVFIPLNPQQFVSHYNDDLDPSFYPVFVTFNVEK